MVAVRNQGVKWAEVAIEKNAEFLVDGAFQLTLKNRLFQGLANIVGREQVRADHLAHALGQFTALGGNDAGGQGQAQAEEAPGVQWPEQHADCNVVGNITDQGPQQRRGKVWQPGQIFQHKA